MTRLMTRLWVEALIRRAQTAGAFAAVVYHGDDERGDVLIKVFVTTDDVRLYGRAFSMDGSLQFERRDLGASDDRSADEVIRKRRGSDPDVWVVEIEDREGRHFITDAVTE